MLLLLLKLDCLPQFTHVTIDADAHKAIRLQLSQFFAIFPLALTNDRRHHQQTGFLRELQHLVDHLLNGL